MYRAFSTSWTCWGQCIKLSVHHEHVGVSVSSFQYIMNMLGSMYQAFSTSWTCRQTPSLIHSCQRKQQWVQREWNPVYLQKTPVYLHKTPVYLQKTPVYLQKTSWCSWKWKRIKLHMFGLYHDFLGLHACGIIPPNHRRWTHMEEAVNKTIVFSKQ